MRGKKKGIQGVLLLLAAVLIFWGCGSSGRENTAASPTDGAVEKQEILQLVNTDLPAIAPDRDHAVELYNSYFSGSRATAGDAESWLEKLQNDALTSYDRYLQNLDQLQYESKEVNELKALYRNCASLQRDAIQQVVNALQSSDSQGLDKAKQDISDSEVYLKQYEDMLKKLCQKNGITISGSFQTSSHFLQNFQVS